jgi:hypothetical protein
LFVAINNKQVIIINIGGSPKEVEFPWSFASHPIRK